MKIWIVKHMPSGKFLPPLKTHTPATRRELSDRPRVFYTKSAAILASRWWAQGQAHWTYDDSQFGYREGVAIESIPIPGRRLKDLRIHECSLLLSKTGEEVKPL